MDNNPYKTPTSQEASELATRTGNENRNVLSAIWFIVCPAFGFVIGLAWYFAASLFAESWIMPNVKPYTSTYGQQAFFISWPISILMGLFAGFSVAPLMSGYRKSSATMLVALSILSTIWIFSIWIEGDRSGSCTSKYVLYYPLFLLSFLIMLAGVIVCFYPTSRRIVG